MGSRTVPRLLLVTDLGAAGGLVAPIERALRQETPRGVAVQLRAKALPARELLEAAVALRAITRAAGALLVVNGRIDVAIAAQADGVHLPETGVPPEAVRALMPEALVGVSCHDAAGLARASAEGADYAVLGPIGRVPGKNEPLGVAGFRALRERTSIPVLALGGVGASEVPALVAAGAHGVAVIRAITEARDPAEALRALGVALDTSVGGAR